MFKLQFLLFFLNEAGFSGVFKTVVLGNVIFILIIGSYAAVYFILDSSYCSNHTNSKIHTIVCVSKRTSSENHICNSVLKFGGGDA